jgi:hypothetical protein
MTGTLMNHIFLGFQEPVLEGTLILKKGFQNRFFGTLRAVSCNITATM